MFYCIRGPHWITCGPVDRKEVHVFAAWMEPLLASRIDTGTFQTLARWLATLPIHLFSVSLSQSVFN